MIDSNYNNTEVPADLPEEQASQPIVKVFAARSKAKAKPQRREPANYLSSIIPMNERKWIDIEPGESSFSAYEISKKVINLRHSQTVQREDDGAVEFWKIKNFLQNQFPQVPYWFDDRWKACLAAGGGAKRRYQYCTDIYGDGDEEHPHSRKRTKIQGVITACIDSGIREGLLQMHESEGSWAARMRLAELGDSSVDHTWLWRLNPRHGLILEADEYIDSVRFRLGCAGPVEPITCAACNSGILDTGSAHASCCALGEATRGHNAVSSLLHAAAQQCDHTAEMEVPGLIPGTDLRPADILTSALGNACTALDVSICSPHASEAGADFTQSRVQAKHQYSKHLLLPSCLERLRATSSRHVGRFALPQ